MKKIINKIKRFNSSKPCIKTGFSAICDVYRAASDKKPAFSFDMGGNIKLGFLQVCVIVLSVTALCVIYTASVSAKYKKKYKKKFEKAKERFEKKQAKLVAAAETDTEE